MTSINNILKNLGRIITISRKKENMTQKELAVQIGVSRLTIANIEKGKNVTIDNILKTFKYFYLLDDLNDLFENMIVQKNNLDNSFTLYE